MDLTTAIQAIRSGTVQLAANFTLTRPYVRAEAVYYQFPQPCKVDASRWEAVGFVVVDYAGRQSANFVRTCDDPRLVAWRGVW